MATNLQIRSVDAEMAAAAKAEAARRRMSLSDYLKELIASDLAAHADARRRAALYDEIARTAPRTGTREDTAAALATVREEMGTG
ncbi:hypothetical protein MWU75_10795 [Ornithinimicrobium sp. F0845]|uniref:hypothetical protein n=1 Tax=Ornithinimicrobium sp. F0845 TaxID=2926412 RepID=UPI001FF69622|nr:hypothetical protein [Ornithinimicrobium sp. F0845]MCK0112628.1 hypothetical protein [Ornithinimicrobium sp. F0845]